MHVFAHLVEKSISTVKCEYSASFSLVFLPLSLIFFSFVFKLLFIMFVLVVHVCTRMYFPGMYSYVFGIYWNLRDGLEWGGKYSVEFTKCVGTFIIIYYDDVLRRF